ncbi:MAG: chemotaxis protein [Crenarchaeota archaeon]|nr:MAG: chemotaxis protein [Thermoproteota archaeon]RDJ33700.1 MAG: chemotaxis protein [Thermoproteota archaeon]RDJ37279.1 MAG: chemotaxis protein [Thermoproteota archaeon]RDJ39233.1 MAG: chemotaxis protein [Thermoproteota archaeon]
MAGKTTKATKKTTKKEPTQAALLKKVATVSDTTKTLSKEIKSMTKIFADNQKVLISMKGMIDTLTTAIEHMQKQSKQINILEEDTQKLFSGLSEVRNHSNIISKINDQTNRLQEELKKIEDVQKSSPESAKLSQQVSESMDSIKNNSQMIIKIAQRVDEVRDDLRKVSAKTENASSINSELNKLKETLKTITEQTSKIQSTDISNLKSELQKMSEKMDSTSQIKSEITSIQKQIESIATRAEKIDSLGTVIDGLKNQFQAISSKAESLLNLSGKIQNLEGEINSLVKRSEATAFMGENLKSVQSDFSDFKDNVYNKTNTIEQKISTLSDLVKRSEDASSEFHRKTDKVFQELQGIKNVTNKASSDSSKEMMALLKLSEYQSTIRMTSESKYGEIKDLESMASQTAEIVNLFDKISIESQEKMPVPHEVRQWAVSKILDCADRWEIRFSDVFNILSNNLGRDLLKESIRLQQVRDIFGIRGVDELRKELGIT